MIIDIHTHAFSPKIADKAITQLSERSRLEPYTRGLTTQLLARMDEWGVDKSCVLSIATKPEQQTVVNNWAASVAQESDRFIPFGSVHPDAPDCIDEIARIKSLGLKGIKMHPDYQKFMVDDPRLDPMYEAIAASGLPLILHAGWDWVSPDLIHCPPERSAKLAKRHPDLKLILAHMGGNDQWHLVHEMLAGIEGDVYFDTSFTANCPDRLMEDIIAKHGADRILFGSDSPWESAQHMIEKLLRINISDDDRELILGKNAERLLFTEE